MKTIVILIIIVNLFFDNYVLIRHPISKETATYEDIEILGGTIVVNIILLVIIGLLFIFT